MLPRATRRLTARTATKPAKSLVRSSVSRTVSPLTTFPHGDHSPRVRHRRKEDKSARGRHAFIGTVTGLGNEMTRPVGTRPGGSKDRRWRRGDARRWRQYLPPFVGRGGSVKGSIKNIAAFAGTKATPRCSAAAYSLGSADSTTRSW